MWYFKLETIAYMHKKPSDYIRHLLVITRIHAKICSKCFKTHVQFAVYYLNCKYNIFFDLIVKNSSIIFEWQISYFSVLNRLNFQLKLKKSRFLENRFWKSTLLGNRFSIKFNFENRFLKIIDYGGIVSQSMNISLIFFIHVLMTHPLMIDALMIHAKNGQNLRKFSKSCKIQY